MANSEDNFPITGATKIDDLNLSVRTYNTLKNLDLNIVADILARTKEELLAQKNFGQSSLHELQQLLAPFGWPRSRKPNSSQLIRSVGNLAEALHRVIDILYEIIILWLDRKERSTNDDEP